MPKEFGGSDTFNVIDLTPCDASAEEPNLRENWEDDAYTKRTNPTLQGPVTRGRLRRIQEKSSAIALLRESFPSWIAQEIHAYQASMMLE
ncbi:hypothetical protein CR513_23441, partial [Mucuna pruriens]